MFYVFWVALASMNLLCGLSNKLCKKYEQNDFYEVFANHFVNIVWYNNFNALLASYIIHHRNHLLTF